MSDTTARPSSSASPLAPVAGVPRRDFLSTTTLAAVGAVLAACGGGGGDGPTSPGGGNVPTTPTAGSKLTIRIADFPALATVGGIAAVGDLGGVPVAVVRSAATTYLGFSRICTHESCVVNVGSTGFNCPCHGSTYNAAGTNTGGPAPRPLAALRVSINGAGTELTLEP